TGASNDLERVTETARRMVTEFGMSKKLGPVRYAASSMAYLHEGTQSRDDLGTTIYADITAEIKEFVSEAQESALNILREHEAALHEVARVLQENEVITGDEIQAILKRLENPEPETLSEV
ncbi:MAG: cell division protein FtsH, partial [Synergistaceae bacterium]|nr:cell division protein FtsH [Synergistaceae bacterium]